ncbi:hypothetical protein DB347_09500 [Opitutaceae bacterium EW11]|nr:hypothetical protein DB347_09500 [Opitutaceae bacterium EW11]
MHVGSLIGEALNIHGKHIRCGVPMNLDMGFREALLVNSVTLAFHDRGYLCYPQFCFQGGAIDAVFVKGANVIVSEFKRLLPGSGRTILNQTKRMLEFDVRQEMAFHQFKPKDWQVAHLWVCDTWDKHTVNWWMGKRRRTTDCPFDPSWRRLGCADFHGPLERYGSDWDPYAVLWAFREGARMSHKRSRPSRC